jgi:carbon monoxide dehydrogenase subunit G
MDLSHRFVVPASPEATWAAFMDLERIAPCFPGATLTSVEGDHFAGTVKIKLGPISMVYSGTGTFVERDEGAGKAVITAKGKDKRGNGTAGATVVAQLTPEGDGTAVEVMTDLSITGKPAQFGRGVIQDVSDKLLNQFVDCIALRLGPSEPEASSAPAAEPSVRTEPARATPSAEAPRSEPAELHLMSAVMPVLLKRYGLPVAGAIVLAIIIWLIVK